jgi:hypothetical protein
VNEHDTHPGDWRAVYAKAREDAAERDRYREALVALVAWVDGWRDVVDDVSEARWSVGFTDTTVELVQARRALDDPLSRNETT